MPLPKHGMIWRGISWAAHGHWTGQRDAGQSGHESNIAGRGIRWVQVNGTKTQDESVRYCTVEY